MPKRVNDFGIVVERPQRTMPTEDCDTKDAVQRVKQKIDRLTEEQSKALQLAIYVGMSRDEAKKCNERLEKIKKLVEELARLAHTHVHPSRAA